MLIEVALTKEIINESLPIHYKSTKLKQKIISYLTPLLLLLYSIFYTIIQPDAVQGWERYIYLISLFIVAVLYALWITYKRNNAGKRMIKMLGERTTYEIEANEEGLVSRFDDATYNQKWTVYPRAVISKEIVLLYQQNKMFSIFHSSFFANEDFGVFKNLVRNHIHEVKEV